MNAESSELLKLLTNGVPHREVYRGKDSRWHVTYGGGEFSNDAVMFLVRDGKIQSVHKELPNDCFHVENKSIQTKSRWPK